MRLFLLSFLFLSSFSYSECTRPDITVHDSKGVKVSTRDADYKAQEDAVRISLKEGMATIKTPDIVCTTKVSSSSSAASSVASSRSQSSSASSVPAGSWVVRADFEGALGSTAVGGDAFSGSTKAIISDEVTAVSGSKVAKLPIPAGCGGCFGTWGGIINFPTPLAKGDEVRIKLSVYWPQGFNYNANPWLKFLRVKTPSGYNDIYIPNAGNSHAYQFIYEGEQQWTRFGTTADKVQFGVWEQYEFYLKFDNVSTTNGGTAMARFWKDGKLLAEIPERRTIGSADQTATAFYLFTYWNGENSPAQHVYVDDITITGTRN